MLSTIPASGGALVRDRRGRLLVLKPTYKAGWTIPGGVVEAVITADTYSHIAPEVARKSAERLANLVNEQPTLDSRWIWPVAAHPTTNE